MAKENLHSGHRHRLRLKYIENKESLNEHEFLELLLGYAIPRIDTNETAHRLLNTFGSLNSVLKTDALLLQTVEGVGENSATFLNLIGDICSTINIKQPDRILVNSIEKVRHHLFNAFRSQDKEIVYIVYLDEKDKAINYSKSDSNSKSFVMVDIEDFTKKLLLYKPKSIIIAHNHFTPHPLPSFADDKTTAQLCMFLKMYNVNLYDHIIFGTESSYSYFYSNRLSVIKENLDTKLYN